jgi:A/G-specific adenine glycosylase
MDALTHHHAPDADGSIARAHLTLEQVSDFHETVYRYYHQHGRDLPWRKTKNPYRIFVSEIMLQQTQVERVIEKYEHFISVFPDFQSLARAELKEVLLVWQGLGYNRRALALARSARIIMAEYGGNVPQELEQLIKLPGIGRATASSILVFAFNKTAVFIETNIRRVFIHHFFEGRKNISDREILPLVEASLDSSNPRAWFHALMDYGSMLKKGIQNPNRKSSHYRKQPPFEGSDRQLRGEILRMFLKESSLSYAEIGGKIQIGSEKLKNTLDRLEQEGFIKEHEEKYTIS